MPRSTQSVESRVLSFFQFAPIAAVLVVVNLAREIVKARQAIPVSTKRRVKRKIRVAPTPIPSKPSHKKKKKPTAEVEDFDSAEG